MVFCFFYYYFIRATCIDFVIFCFLLAYLAFGWTGRIHRMHNAYTYIRILHTFQTDSVSLCPSLSLFVVPLILFFSFIRSNAKFCCFHTQDFWINLAQKMTEGPWLKCLLKWTVCSGCSRSMKKMHLKSNCVHNFRPVEKKIYQGLMYRCKICLRPPVSPNNFFFDFFCSRLARYCVFNEKKKKTVATWMWTPLPWVCLFFMTRSIDWYHNKNWFFYFLSSRLLRELPPIFRFTLFFFFYLSPSLTS